MPKSFKIFLIVITLLFSSENLFAVEQDNIFLIDVSKSMIGYGDGNGNDIFPQVKQAIQAYLGSLNPGSKVTIIPFAGTTRKAHTFTIDDRNHASEFIQSLTADGKNTNIYGTLYRALMSVPEKSEKPIAIYLFTDGKDNVHERELLDVIRKYKAIRQENPFVWIFYNDLSNQDNNPDLDKLKDSDAVVFRIDRTISPQQLQKLIQEFMESGRALINQQAAKIRKEREALQSEKQKIQSERQKLLAHESKLESREAEIRKRLNNISEKEAQTRDTLNAELKQIRNQKQEVEGLRSELRLKERQIADAKSELQSERQELEKAALQREEINQLLSAADILVKEAAELEKDAAIEKYEEAIDKYEAVLEKESDNVLGLSGLEQAERLLGQRKNFLEKNWFFIIIGLIAVAFCGLALRRPFLDWWTIEPIRLDIGYNLQGNHLPPAESVTRSFLRQRFRKKGDTFFISRVDKEQIPIDHEAVLPVRHAQIFRKGNTIFVEKLNGQLLNEHQQPVSESARIGQEESFYLTHEQTEDTVKITLTRK